jgi:hypothetical protein
VIALLPFVAPLIGAVAGAASKSSSDRTAKKAADAQNKIEKQKAEAQFARAQQEYELNWQESLTNYYWSQAQTEQVRQIESQTAVDKATMGARMIWGAAENYMLNSSALFDKFRTQENLRQTGVSQEYRQAMEQSAFKLEDTSNQMRRAVSEYMIGVLRNSNEAKMKVSGMQGELTKAMSALTTQEMVENYKYNATVLLAAMDASIAGNTAISTSGGGNTAKAAAMNGAKRAMTEFAGLHLGRQARNAQIGELNTQMRGQFAQELAGIALQSRQYEQQIGYALTAGKTGFDRISSEAMYTANTFEKLTIPSFKIQNDQYQRELKALQLNTTDTLYNATLPYRQREVFDPLKPQKGIAPTYYAPTPVQAQTGGFLSLASSALSGAQSTAPNFFSSTLPNLVGTLFK